MEPAAQKRVQYFLDQTVSVPSHQSADRQWHTSETALLKIYNEQLRAADRDGELTALRPVGLSAALGIRGWLGGVTVRASDLRSSGRGFDSQSGRYQAT